MAFSTTFRFRRTCGAELAKWYKKLALFQTCLLFRTAVFLFALLLQSNNDNPVLFVAPTPVEMVKIAHYAIVVACNCRSRSSSVVESLPVMREAWVQSCAAPTKALEQGLHLYLLLGPYLDGAPA